MFITREVLNKQSALCVEGEGERVRGERWYGGGRGETLSVYTYYAWHCLLHHRSHKHTVARLRVSPPSLTVSVRVCSDPWMCYPGI